MNASKKSQIVGKLSGLIQFTLVVLLLAGTGWRAVAEPLSENDLREIKRIEFQLSEGTLPQPPGWWVNHGAGDEGLKELELVGYPDDQTDLAAIAMRAGGWRKYKTNVASLLKSKDLVIRGYAAIWMADLGDQEYAKDLLGLLEKEPLPGGKEYSLHIDRECAAEALGILQAKKYSPTLLTYLSSDNARLRSGAAKGLGWMPGGETHKAVAKLLDDPESEVQEAAILALARMGAKQYAARISDHLSDRPRTLIDDAVILQALVMLEAKDQGPVIAKLLDAPDRSLPCGLAVQALALLECREFASEISELLKGEDGFLCADVMVSLAVLGEAKYAPEIAKYLNSKDRSLQQAAAWALIYMDLEEFRTDAVKTYNEFDHLQSGVGLDLQLPKTIRINRRFESNLRRARQQKPPQA